MSPQKTVEGALGGLLAAIVTGLDRYGVPHAAHVCGEPPTLLLLDLPQVAPPLYEVVVQRIQKYARLLERQAPAGP